MAKQLIYTSITIHTFKLIRDYIIDLYNGTTYDSHIITMYKEGDILYIHYLVLEVELEMHILRLFDYGHTITKIEPYGYNREHT